MDAHAHDGANDGGDVRMNTQPTDPTDAATGAATGADSTASAAAAHLDAADTDDAHADDLHAETADVHEDDAHASNPIGERLRNIRRQQGMSLADVQTRSNGKWKSVVVGAYERGDRSISIARLAELTEFYGVPLVDVMPATSAELAIDRSDDSSDARRAMSAPVRLDLTRLRKPRTPEVAAVARFARQVQRRRGDHNGKVLTLRGGDLSTIAIAVGREDDALMGLLRDEGVVSAA